MPGVQRARSLACKVKKHTSIVTTVTPERPGIPRAMVLRLTSRSPRRSGLLSPSSARLLADLTPASGRQNHTTSPSASAPFVTRAARVHRIPPRVRDVRTPLCLGRDGRGYIADLGVLASKISEFQKSFGALLERKCSSASGEQ